MRFWDSSAVVPLCIDAPNAPAIRALLRADEAMAVWWATHTECVSALARQVRDRALDVRGERQARAVLAALSRAWAEVQPSQAVRTSAERLLRRHPLRAADAFQLASALQWCGGRPDSEEFVSFDERLRASAEREGFAVFPAT
ncbi:MAG: type II toxin-antitoxin system VapC family toxin [Chloroflexota bacterium]|nr:type II toxin-antitoxin system VapC family toxin [Chloroflexota bacterium]